MNRRNQQVLSLIGGILLAATLDSARANPNGGVVVAGSAKIATPSASVMNISQSTSSAVINWQSFSIASGAQVNFLQPSVTSTTLNRVLDGQKSIIDGALNANGRVFLLNSSGILFGKNASVNVGGLLATTSAIADSDLMAGRLNFTGSARPGAAVENLGSITAADGGFAALVAPTVRNSGVINARLGHVALGAGDVFTVDFYGDNLINFAVPAAGSASREVTQSGSLIADGGHVLLTTDAAAGVVHGVVNMSGLIQADSATQLAGGEIMLSGANTDISVSGLLSAKGTNPGTTGGTINVLGSSVSLTPAAVVNATGDAGGGTVRLGGGFHDEAAIRVASTTSVNSGALIDVSATGTGDAGRVSVWGNGQVLMAGQILAHGGSTGGNGGYVEVAGQNQVSLTGAIATSAPLGKGGTLLLDPATITIEPSGAGDLTGSTISGNAINTLLRQGTSVQLVADNSITVNDLVDGRSTSSTATSGGVSFQAGTIVLMQPVITNNAAISLTANTGDITFQANAFLAVLNTAATSGVGTAPITLTAAGNVTGTQLISLGKVSVTATGNVALAQALNGLESSGSATGIGALTVNAQGTATVAGVDSSGDVSISGVEGVSLTGPAFSGGALSLTASGTSSSIALAAPVTAGTPGAEAVGNITLLTPGAVTLNSSVLSHGGNIAIGSQAASVGQITMASGTALQSVLTTTATAQSGGISVFTTQNFTAQDLLAGTGGAINIQSQGGVTLNKGLFGLSGSSGIGSLTVQATGNVAAVGATAGSISLTSSGGSVTDSAAALDATTNGITVSGQSIQMAAIPNSGASTYAYGLTSAGNIQLTSPGAVTLDSSVLSSAGDVQIGVSTTNRVGSLVMGPGTAIQSVIPASATVPAPNQTGGISIFTAGDFTAQDLIAGSKGTISIDGTGAATLNGLFGLQSAGNAAGIGALNVTSTGNLTLHGAQVNGAINLTSGGLLHDSTAALTSTGTVTLTGGSIQLDQIPDAVTGNPADAVISAASDVNLLSGGAVTLNSAILSKNGNIQIGSTTPVASVSTGYVLPGWETGSAASWQVSSPSLASYVLLQSGSPTGSIEVNATGSVAVSSLVTGTNGSVSLGGHDVMVAGTINNSTTNGVGEVSITSANSITVHGIQVSGNLHNITLPASSASSDPTATSLALITGAPAAGATTGGSINVLGPLVSGGPVFIGQTGTYQAGGAAAQINLSDSIASSGKSVTINGDVTLFKGITQWDIECLLTGICIDAVNRPDLDIGLSTTAATDVAPKTNGVFTGGIGGTLETGNGDYLPAIFSSYCLANQCTLANASAFAPIIGQPAAGPLQVLSCQTPSFSCSGLTSGSGNTATLNCSNTNQCYDSATGNTITTPVSLMGYSALYVPNGATIGNLQSLVLSKQTIFAVGYPAAGSAPGTPGVLLTAYNTTSAPAQSSNTECVNAFICGINLPDLLGSSGAAVQTAAVNLANPRILAMSNLLGELGVNIDTTAGNSLTGGTVTLTGNVGRYRGPSVTSPLTDNCIGGTCSILPTFVSSSISVNAGTTHTLTIGGTIGDDTLLTTLPTISVNGDGNPDSGVFLDSGLGFFSVALTAGTVTLSQHQPQQYDPGNNTCSTQFCVTGFTVAASNAASYIQSTPVGILWFQGATDATPGIINAPSTATPGVTTGTSSSSSTAAGVSVTGVGQQPSGASGGSSILTAGNVQGFSGLPSITDITSTGTGTGSSGSTGSTGGTGSSTSTSETSGGLSTSPAATTLLAASTFDSTDDSLGVLATTNSPGGVPLLETDVQCPRGAAKLADLGQRPGYGITPNVFARCHP